LKFDFLSYVIIHNFFLRTFLKKPVKIIPPLPFKLNQISPLKKIRLRRPPQKARFLINFV